MKKEKNKGFLGFVERVGNALPHPAIIFLILSVIVIIVSYFVALAGVEVVYYDARSQQQVTLRAVNMLSAEGLRYIFSNAAKNFTGFAPLGTVLVAMLGVGVAENSGLIGAALRKLLNNVPKVLLTSVVVFAGIMSNVASDAGYVVVIPLGAIVFAGSKRHPIAGLAAAFAGVSAGFSANLLIGTLDPLIGGLTNEALKASGIDYNVLPTANYYFLVASTFLLTIVGAFVTDRIIEPRLGEYKGKIDQNSEKLTPIENKGLRNAGLTILAFSLIILYFSINLGLPGSGILQEADAAGNVNINTFLSKGLILFILLIFLLPGYAYGKTTGYIKNSNDLVSGMTKSMESMGGYLVLSFFAAQFVNYFGFTNLGTILSVKGAELLKSINLTGIPLVIVFIFVSAFLNLFMGSASAKWAIMAPVFVPMLFDVGISPELTQMAYRIGDSTTNIISPLMAYFAMILVFMQKYDKKSGLGTLISTMFPYSIAFSISWTILLILWIIIGLPLGPGAPLFL